MPPDAIVANQAASTALSTDKASAARRQAGFHRALHSRKSKSTYTLLVSNSTNARAIGDFWSLRCTSHTAEIASGSSSGRYTTPSMRPP